MVGVGALCEETTERRRVEAALRLLADTSDVLATSLDHDQTLREVARFVGYTNHVTGAAELGLSAVFDVNGDGISDIVLPSQDRRELRAVTFAKGTLAALESVKLHRAVTTALVVADVDRNGALDIVFGDEGGYVNVILR